jgi:hypothetical protein
MRTSSRRLVIGSLTSKFARRTLNPDLAPPSECSTRQGSGKQPRSTVRMALTAPGEVAEMDFGKLGTLINPYAIGHGLSGPTQANQEYPPGLP